MGTPIKVENGSGLMIATDAVEVQRATTTYDHLSRLIICVKPNFDVKCKMTLDLAEKIGRQTSVDRDVSMVSAKIERQLYCQITAPKYLAF